MSPPQQTETVILENVVEDGQFDIKKLAAKGYYLEFPKKTV
jgi:hypothetical protein